MPRKSMKKMMKELMAKKKLTAKEKKMLMKMQKGGVWWNPFSWGASTPEGPVDQATLTKQFDDLKGQICKVCKAAFGEDGCKCGNTAPEPSPMSGNLPATELKENQSPSGEGDLAQQGEMSAEEIDSMEQSKSQPQPQPVKPMAGGRSKSMKRKMKRYKRMSRKMGY